MEDRFPEQSETDFTCLVDQKNSENTKKAAKVFTVSTIKSLQMKLRREEKQFISAVT